MLDRASRSCGGWVQVLEDFLRLHEEAADLTHVNILAELLMEGHKWAEAQAAILQAHKRAGEQTLPIDLQASAGASSPLTMGCHTGIEVSRVAYLGFVVHGAGTQTISQCVCLPVYPQVGPQLVRGDNACRPNCRLAGWRRFAYREQGAKAHCLASS